jgi:hypothetical protein
MILALLFSVLALAAEPQVLWSLPYPGEKPVAVFFDATSGALFVSVKEGERARLDRVSLDGKIEKKGLATAKGEPGPLRAFDGKLYWIAGSAVQIVDPKGGRGSMPNVPEKSLATDIAISRDGAVFLAFRDGSLYRLKEKRAELLKQGKPIRALLLLQDQLHVLRAGALETMSLAKSEEASEAFCDCTGLERSSRATWLTVQGPKVLEGKRPLLTLKTEIGRLAYVYRMNTDEDFFVLPLPAERIVRAYRMPGAAKAERTDK